MKNKILLFFILIIFANVSAANDERILLKIPQKNRKDLLKSMRKYIDAMEKIHLALSKKDFSKVEDIARIWLLDEKRKFQSNLRFKENDQFIALAVDFHTTATVEIIQAARKKDIDATLLSLSHFFAKCNGCHSTFRVVEWPDKDFPPVKPRSLNIPANYHYNDWVKKEYQSKN